MDIENELKAQMKAAPPQLRAYVKKLMAEHEKMASREGDLLARLALAEARAKRAEAKVPASGLADDLSNDDLAFIALKGKPRQC